MQLSDIGLISDGDTINLVATDKKIIGIKIDPDFETADVDLTNNSWPKEQQMSEFDQFKARMKN